MLMMEEKIPDMLGYDVICSRAAPTTAGGAQGGVGLVTRVRPEGGYINSMRFHGLNMVSCNIVYRL